MTLTTLESTILRSIQVASENDPLKPEFPPDNPKFPATPTYQIKVPGFTNVWLKDESVNPTGTHKDRMAWEMVVTYRDFLLAKKEGLIKDKLPQMSIITSGSAGFAIQSMLRRYKLPNLKCVVDIHLPEHTVHMLESIGCEVYRTDLSRKPFHWKEILEISHNSEGIDITSNSALDPVTRYYDWMSYEVLNSSSDYCFIPFGTGNLYENVLNINKKEVLSGVHDPRFSGNVQTLKHCNFMGATVNDPKSKADKLYSSHLPFVHFDEQWIKIYKLEGSCGSESNVYVVHERFIEEAIELAKENKVFCEPSGIAGLALFLQMKQKIPKDKKILIVNTGKTTWPE